MVVGSSVVMAAFFSYVFYLILCGEEPPLRNGSHKECLERYRKCIARRDVCKLIKLQTKEQLYHYITTPYY